MSSSPGNILLIQLGDIGDVVLSLPCVRAIKETYPDANVVLAVREKAGELIDYCKWASAVVAVAGPERGLWRKLQGHKELFRRLRGYRFDWAIDLRTGDRGAIMALLSGARRRTAHYVVDGKLWRNRFFTDLLKLDLAPDRHIIDQHLDLLAACGITTRHKVPELTISAEKRQGLLSLLATEKVPQDRPMVAVQPFSLWQYKEWPQEKFIELIRWLVRRFHLSVIITGAPQEQEKALELIDRCGERVYSLAGKTSIGMYAALLHACSLLISVDSAGPHIAAATGTPTVTIYGPVSPETWAPRGEDHLVVQKDLPCVPCNRTGCDGSMKSRCIEELEVAEVVPAVEKQLKRILELCK